jgi:hypothetical protein
MHTRWLYTLVLLLIPLSSVAAQRADTSSQRRSDSLRHRIEERFASRVQEELGLNSEQTTRLRATSQTFGTRRRELRDRERQIKEALSQQLRPGVAANNDSVVKLTDALLQLKLAAAQAARDEMKEVAGYLNPVQRARLLMMRERFYDRVKKAHNHHGMGRRHKDRSWM